MDLVSTGPIPRGGPKHDNIEVFPPARDLGAARRDHGASDKPGIIIDGEFKELPEKKGLLKRFFERATKKEVLKDMAAGAGVTLAVRYGSLVLLGGAGLTGLPLIATSAVAASVARTVWTMHKERKAHYLASGEKLSFWQWATKSGVSKDEAGNEIILDNKKKYLLSLGVGTIGAALGSYAVVDLLPRASEYLAPVTQKIGAFLAPAAERVRESRMGGAVLGFMSNVFGIGASKAVVSETVSAAAVVREEAAVPSKHEIDLNKFLSERQPLPAYLQEFLDSAPPAKAPETNVVSGGTAPSETISGATDTAKAEAKVSEEKVATAAAATAGVAPVISVRDRISALVGDSKLNRRWTAIAENAMAGNVQAQKDVAMAVLNGNSGFVKNPAEALELYREAAAAGNKQAKVDLSFIKYHGLAGVEANRSEALKELREFAANNRYARETLRGIQNIGKVVVPPVMPEAVGAAAALQQTAADAAKKTAAAVAAPVAQAVAPNVASLSIEWGMNAEGRIVGKILNPFPGLEEGMKFKIPTVDIKRDLN